MQTTDRQAELVERISGDRSTGLLVICDHASNWLPAEYGSLGLDPGQLQRHIAYDIGAAGVTRRLAARFGCPAVLSKTSRLLIDLNRGADDPTLVMRLSDGAIVPGNRYVDAAEVELRIQRYFRPYHDAVADELSAIELTGRAPIILSIHSFTDRWKGRPRPWHIGILWDRDDRLARPLIDTLSQQKDLIVGDNEPYSGRLEGDCLNRHGTSNGFAHVLIEVRQDLIADTTGENFWADRLAGAIDNVLRDQKISARLNQRLRNARTLSTGRIAEMTPDAIVAAHQRRL